MAKLIDCNLLKIVVKPKVIGADFNLPLYYTVFMIYVDVNYFI